MTHRSTVGVSSESDSHLIEWKVQVRLLQYAKNLLMHINVDILDTPYLVIYTNSLPLEGYVTCIAVTDALCIIKDRKFHVRRQSSAYVSRNLNY